MKTKVNSVFIFLLIATAGLHAVAQNTNKQLAIRVTLDHKDWVYKTGQAARFRITIAGADQAMANDTLHYEIGLEKMHPLMTGNMKLKNGSYTVKGGTLNEPGFLRCIVTTDIRGKKTKSLATAAYSAEKIRATAAMPADFSSFWSEARNAALQLPLDTKMELMPERCTDKLNVYHVSIRNFRSNARLYGILCMPKKSGKYPAILKVPGAGIRPYYGDTALANKGFIVFEIGIHGIPVNLPLQMYYDLAGGALYDYSSINIVDRDKYYYKRVYLGCLRANDFLLSLPETDSSRLIVYGGSQGGALSIVTAALDHRVNYLAAFYPALSDVTGYLHQRAGGWPHMFSPAANPKPFLQEKIYTMSYYDVANFARLITAPGIYAWGFNDEVCPPTSIYSAYNHITAPKEVVITKEAGHGLSAVQNKAVNEWLVKKAGAEKL